MSVMGTRVERREDPVFLTGSARYTADLDESLLAGALHAHFVRSTIAHARITELDVSEALSAPGVVGVFTMDDIESAGDLSPYGVAIPGMIPDALARPWLAAGVVRFVGEAVAVVVAETARQAVDAAESIVIDYDPLDVVVDPVVAATDAVLVQEHHGSNTALAVPFGRTDDLFDGCEVVVSGTLVNQRVAVCPLEVRSVATTWRDGRLLMWCSTQGAHSVRRKLAGIYGLEPEQVRVVAPAVGGGFGAKINLQADEALLPWLSRRVGRPVRWTETRSESMVSMPHGRGQVDTFEIGGRRDGTIEAYRLDVLQDTGAYPGMGTFLPFMTRTMAQGVYVIDRVECEVRSVMTNTTPIEAYRGAGRPEATAAIERAMDMFAAEIGMDPAEVRRINLIKPFSEPHTTSIGQTYDVGNYEESLNRVLAAVDYPALRAEQAARRASGDVKQLGIGISVYVEITGGVPPMGEEAKIEVLPSGRAIVYTGTSPHGQGHLTSWSMIASSETGIPMDQIDLVWGDTDLVPVGGGTMGSRSLQQGGAAVQKAAIELVDQAKKFAARLLEADEADVVLDIDRGVFHVAGTPAVTATWSDCAGAASGEGGLVHATTFSASSATFPFGAHVAVVEVDTETGKVRHLRHVACDDAGRVLNPLLLEGQIHGGVAQGTAQALLEEVRYDADGNPITSNLADYAFISAAELPSFEVIHMETPTPVNPLGAKGIGESGTIGSTPAVQSAVVDALGHLGVRHVDMPATAERVWQAIQAAKG